jgi:hypothetical protein
MTLKVSTRFAGGNAAAIEIVTSEPVPEIRFASDPCGGTEALWFYFKVEETDPIPATQTKVKLTWMFFDNMTGSGDVSTCIPVCMGPGRTWSRLKQGEETRTPDGRRQLSWTIPHPSPSQEIAFCFPYGAAELDSVLERCKDYWHQAPIGVSQNGNPIVRVHNAIGTSGSTHPGIYILARQHAGETPGSWVLDGLLRYWAQVKKGGYVIWAVPFVDVDGIMWGHYGRDGFPYDLDRAWSNPSPRHEAMLIRNDIQRWKSRCKPVLALDLHSPGANDRDGVFAYASDDAKGSTSAEENKWCNVLKGELQPDYAATEFRRIDNRPARLVTPSFVSYMRQELGIPAVNLQIPYTLAGSNVLTQKSYREIGQKIGQALHRRNG